MEGLPPRLLAGCPDGPRPCLRSWRLERPRQSRLDQRHEQRAQGRPRGRRARLDAPAARRRYLGWRPTRLRRGGRRRSGLAHAGPGQTMVPAGQGGKPLLASPQPTWPRAANSQIRCLGLFHGAGLSLRPIDLADRPDTLKAAAGVSPIPTGRYVRAAPVRTNQGDPSCPHPSPDRGHVPRMLTAEFVARAREDQAARRLATIVPGFGALNATALVGDRHRRDLPQGGSRCLAGPRARQATLVEVVARIPTAWARDFGLSRPTLERAWATCWTSPVRQRTLSFLPRAQSRSVGGDADRRIANMLLLAGFVILVSGYLGFAARREGASLVHASLLALLSAAVLQALVAGGTVWLSGTPLTHVIEPAITAWALACAAALSGALAAGLYPIREPFARWHAWDAAA